MAVVLRQAASYAQHWLKDTFSYWERPLYILRNYQQGDLRADLLAGLTVAIVLMPQAIAYAVVAELPPQMGLYTAIIAAIIGALWGSSKHLNTGPTNAASLLVLTTLSTVAFPGSPEYIAAAGLMALMVGIARLLMGLARLGVLVNFVSDSVVIGFTAGAGVLIAVNQLKQFIGVNIPNSASMFVTLRDLFYALPQTHLLTFLLGVFTLVLMITVKRFKPRWPNALISFVASILLVYLFNLEGHGVAVLGALPRGLPPLAHLQFFNLELIGKLSTGALAISVIGLVEAVSIARSISALSGQYLDSNQEFVGQGLANILSGLFSGYSSSGSFIRSAVNYSSGARTQLSNVFTGLIVLVAMLVFAPITAFLPRTALAGVLLVISYNMIDRKEVTRIWHASRGDSLIMVATFLGTLLLPLQFAVLAGVIVSFARYIYRTSLPSVYPVVPDANFLHFSRDEGHPECPQLSIMTIGGALYFGAAHHVEEVLRARLEKHPEQRVLMLRMQVVDHCDVSGIHMLEAIVRLYRNRGGDVYLSGVRRIVREQMALIGFDKFLGEDHFLLREDAISHLFHKVLDPSVCIYECNVRVFAECQALPKYEVQGSHADHTAVPLHIIKHWLPSELKAYVDHGGINGNVLLIDVREPREYKNGHVPHAQLLPLRLISEKGPHLPRDQRIILICRSGRRSRLAALILQDMGYEEVYNLQGGMLAWDAAGYPVAVE